MLPTIRKLAIIVFLLYPTFAQGEVLFAAGALRPTVRRGAIAFVAVAMGGVVLEGERPTLSGIVYDPKGGKYILSRKPLHYDFSNYLAWQIRPDAPIGKWTVHATIERDSRAWGMPATVTVVP